MGSVARGVSETHPIILLLWRIAWSGMGFVCLKKAVLRSATVGIERRCFWEARQHDTQNFASSKVYLGEV